MSLSLTLVLKHDSMSYILHWFSRKSCKRNAKTIL